MSKSEIILKITELGLEWAKILIPAFITWHLKQPPWMNRKNENKDG